MFCYIFQNRIHYETNNHHKPTRVIMFLKTSVLVLLAILPSFLGAQEIDSTVMAELGEYMKERGITEFYTKKIDEIPKHRPTAYARGTLGVHPSDTTKGIERLAVAWIFPEQCDLFDGVKKVEVKAFSEIDTLIDNEATNIVLEREEARYDLTPEAQGRLFNWEGDGYFFELVIIRALSEYEQRLLSENKGKRLLYYVDTKFKRHGQTVKVEIEDPRKHLFHPLDLGRPYMFHWDRWYKKDGSIKRQTLTFIREEDFL